MFSSNVGLGQYQDQERGVRQFHPKGQPDAGVNLPGELCSALLQ